MSLVVEGAHDHFTVEDDDPHIVLSAGWADLDQDTPGKLIFDSGALWRLFREDDCYIWRFVSPYLGRGAYKMARINQDFKTGEVWLHRPFFSPERAVYPLEYPLDELLLVNLLARGRGSQLHACGVVDESDNAYLFVGQSEAGKSTMARLWECHANATILSDDRIVLREMDGRFWMYGTPWHGEARYSRAMKAPLNQIFFLRQGERNELTQLNGADTAARLFACSFPTYYDADGLDFTLWFFEQVAAALPCYELSFIRDVEVVDFVHRHAV